MIGKNILIIHYTIVDTINEIVIFFTVDNKFQKSEFFNQTYIFDEKTRLAVKEFIKPNKVCYKKTDNIDISMNFFGKFLFYIPNFPPLK